MEADLTTADVKTITRVFVERVEVAQRKNQDGSITRTGEVLAQLKAADGTVVRTVRCPLVSVLGLLGATFRNAVLADITTATGIAFQNPAG